MNSVRSPAFLVAALRPVVVVPGACVEGALAMALPWLVAQATLGTPWLGMASAGLVLAAMLGTLAAPVLERRLGNRNMTVITGFAVVAGLGAAGLCWVLSLPTLAYGFGLAAIAADAACDLGFSSRMPLLARLAGQRLEQFSSTNWLWGIGGAAAGSILAGWAITAQRGTELVVGLVSLSLVVAAGLALLLPRDSRTRASERQLMRALFERQFWTAGAARVTFVLFALVFFAGPIDNLLLPAHLVARDLPANTFGDMLAAVGLGLAAGLWATRSNGPATNRRATVVLGLLGVAAQLGLILWLPEQWLLLTGIFLSAAFVAPLLPMLEAAVLTAARPAQRTLMLATVTTLVGMADVLGTLTFGAVVSWSNSAVALGICFAIACAAALVCGIWLYGGHRGNDGDGVSP